MTGTAKKSDPALWDRIKHEVTSGDRGGKPGQWSARKAQLAVAAYKSQGGGYLGRKDKDNHLSQWTREDWGTKSGDPSGETNERYLPRHTRDHLTDEEYGKTTAKKRADTRAGKQYSAQPGPIARKTAADRDHPARTRADLLRMARDAGVPGRSRMNKSQLLDALGQ